MKRKRKGHLPFWTKPIVLGNGNTGRIIWLSLWAGMVLASIALYLLAFNNFQSFAATYLDFPLLFLLFLGFYFTIGSAYLIFWGYAEDEEIR